MLKRSFLFIFFITLVSLSNHLLCNNPPFEIGGFISDNRIVKLNSQKLLLIDFWATWCGPCISATQQLEILQETKPNDLYVVAISDESEEIIRKYLENRPIQVAVVKDKINDGLISKYNVKRWPHAVLLTMNGDLIYSGHPSDITMKMIEKEAAKIKKSSSVKWTDLFVVQPESPKKVISGNIFSIEKNVNSEKNMYSENGVFRYMGTVSDLIQRLLDVSSRQISLQNMKDYYIDFKCSEFFLSNKQIVLSRLLDELNLKIGQENKTVDAVLLQVKNNTKLWDDQQFEWGNNPLNNYIIGSDRIEADNASIKQIGNLLTELKGKIYYPESEDNTLHDWDFHYLYDNLMKDDLEYNFGIILKEKKITIPFYVVYM